MAQAQEERRLLAIMFTDVVAYTALTERDEASAVRVRERHRDLVRAMVERFEGELVDATGDESLSIFPSALGAVDCARALQQACAATPDLRLRIGIHLGDVLRHGGEVIGEGVNVAARIRPLAEAGGIVVSEPVYQMVRSRAHVRARPLGARALKNVALPVRVYALTVADADQVARSARPRSRARIAALLGVVLVAAGLAIANRVAIGTWLALNLPRVIGRPLAQQIGFATTSDGVRIAFATSGQGPPLVAVSGWFTQLTEGLGSPLYDAAGVIRWFSRDHLVVRYDGRGFGLSDRDATDFGLEARVRDLEAVVDALDLERFDLYALSAGGPTAVAYVARHPERVSRLVLVGTYLGFRGFGPHPDEGEHSRREAEREMWGFARASWDSPAARAAVVEFLVPDAGEVERRVLMHLFHVSGDGPAFASFVEASYQIDTSQEAKRIRVPTLVVAGSEDRTNPVAASRALAAAIPGARFEILEGADHLEAVGNDPRQRRMVSAFLAEGPGVSAVE